MDKKSHESQPIVNKHKTIIVFDWDDTLFPSSHLFDSNMDDNYNVTCADLDNDKNSSEKWNCLSEKITYLMLLSQSYGKTFIVTNSQTGWVEISLEKYLPKICDIFDDLQIISARSRHESIRNTSPFRWKMMAFSKIIEDISPTNIICIGDQFHDCQAMIEATHFVDNVQVKTIKLSQQPSLDDIVSQLQILIDNFKIIHDHDGELHMNMCKN
jgi:hypothetical protein